jgi:hypothetical protein
MDRATPAVTASRDRLDGRALLFAVLAGFTLLHLVLAVSVPLSGDEIYYWDCSRHWTAPALASAMVSQPRVEGLS